MRTEKIKITLTLYDDGDVKFDMTSDKDIAPGIRGLLVNGMLECAKEVLPKASIREVYESKAT
jgi:hypothetical protein